MGDIKFYSPVDFDDTSSGVTIEGNLIAKTNVGIGTTSPGYPFSLENSGTGLISRIYNTNANGQGLLIRAGATTSATRAFQVASSNDTKIMTVNSNGNVGIGTTSPNQKLQVSGNIAATAFLGDGSALTGIPTTSPAGNDNNIQYNNSGAFAGSNNFVYTHTNGRLGIGLSNPSTAVEIKNTVAPTLTITNGGGAGASTSPTIHLKRLDTVGSKLVYGPADKNFIIQNDFDTTSTLYGRIDFRTRGNQTRMRILAEGNVGIGVTPTAKLHVDGSFIAGSSTTSGLFYNRAVDTLAISNLIMLEKSGANIYIGKASTNLIFRSNNSERARFTSNGRFGIGTTNPAYPLHVNGQGLFGAAFASGFYLSPANLTMYIGGSSSLSKSGASLIVGGAGYTGLLFRQTAGYVIRTDSNGQVNIGGSAPTAKLTVTGRGTTSSTINLQLKNSSSAELLRVGDDGQVGVGTNSPASKLHVAGGIQLADDGATASAAKVGTIRYRTSGNNSYVDMCMQTGASTYAWVNIVQNNW